MSKLLKTVTVHGVDYQMLLRPVENAAVVTIDREFVMEHGVRLTRHLSEGDVRGIRQNQSKTHTRPSLVGKEAFFFPVLTPCMAKMDLEGTARQSAFPGNWLWVWDSPLPH